MWQCQLPRRLPSCRLMTSTGRVWSASVCCICHEARHPVAVFSTLWLLVVQCSNCSRSLLFESWSIQPWSCYMAAVRQKLSTMSSSHIVIAVSKSSTVGNFKKTLDSAFPETSFYNRWVCWSAQCGYSGHSLTRIVQFGFGRRCTNMTSKWLAVRMPKKLSNVCRRLEQRWKS